MLSYDRISVQRMSALHLHLLDSHEESHLGKVLYIRVNELKDLPAECKYEVVAEARSFEEAEKVAKRYCAETSHDFRQLIILSFPDYSLAGNTLPSLES